MENYDIFRLNNFLIYKKTGTDGLSIYDWNKKKFAFKNENSERELLKINDIYINDRNSDIELIDLVEREQENSFSSVVNYYSDMSEVQLHKKTILYLIKDKDFDMLQDLFDKIEDDQSYSYLFVYAIKKLIQYGNSPSLLKGNIELTEENQEIVTTLSISMISDALLKYFEYFKVFHLHIQLRIHNRCQNVYTYELHDQIHSKMERIPVQILKSRRQRIHIQINQRLCNHAFTKLGQ